MKGQIEILPVMLITIVFVVVAVGILFYFQNVGVSEVEQSRLVLNIENSVKKIRLRPEGSSEVFTFNVPEEMKTMCFLKEGYDRFAFPQLEVQARLREDKNVFFDPVDFDPVFIQGIELEENPLCVDVENRKVELTFISGENKTIISAQEPLSQECSSLLFNGEDKIDVVFLGLGYKSTSELRNDVSIYINSLGGVFPFSINKDKFNFYISNVPFRDCNLEGYIRCDNFQLQQQASVCPNDFVILLVERNKILNLALPIRSSSVNNIMKVNTADDILVFAHEFGHLFGNLADEYVDDSYYQKFNLKAKSLPNCDELPCNKWQGVGNTSCFPGCSIGNFYRPTKNSIMNLYFREGGNVYGPVSENELIRLLGVYS